MQDVEIVKELMANLTEAIDLADDVLPVRNYKEVLEKAEKSIAGEELYVEAIQAWGAASQLDLTIEECSELIKVIQKWKRASDNIGGSFTSLAEDVIEEIADVEIMCSQMRVLFGQTPVSCIKEVKLLKLRKMLDEEKVRQIT